MDNSAFIRNLLRQLLESEHEVVDEAGDGVEAVELYRGLELNVVTMDVVMPIRGGIEATSEIKSFDAGTPVIMYTSVGQEEKMRETVKAGTDGYTTKPFQRPNVLQAITGMIQAEA